MPWNAESFRSKHNKKLSAESAAGAASQANAMLKAGVPEGEAIATANKHANKTDAERAKSRYGKK